MNDAPIEEAWTPLALVVGAGHLVAEAEAELRNGLGDVVELRTVPTPAAAVEAATRPVALAVVACVSQSVDKMLEVLMASPHLAHARMLVLSGPEVPGASHSVDAGWVDAFIGLPMTPGFLAKHAANQFARWMRRHGPPAAPTASEAQARERIAQVTARPESELLRDLDASDGVLMVELMDAIERVLGPRPRVRLPAGVRLTHQDRHLDGVYVLLSGRVALTRVNQGKEILFHHATTGRIVGLLALANRRTAYFTATTTSPTVLVHLSQDQLDRALRLEGQVAAVLAATAITVLGSRLQRAEQLQIERDELTDHLRTERAELARALSALEEARLSLVTQARFATLGELSAGIAHELNNPVAALVRSTEHLTSDVKALLASHPRGPMLVQAIAEAATRPPLPTRAERAARRAITARIGDDALARRLVTAGITEVERAAQLASHPADLEIVERAASLGTAVRAINQAAGHITRLVASLRNYARPESGPRDGVDVNETLQDTFQLVSHRLHGIDIDRDYGQLPVIRARAAELGQVWTNVLVNAAEALGGQGRIKVTTRQDGEWIVVQISDNGPGISPDVLAHVFTPRFTTKHGTVRFGLGLGLDIAKRFVTEHGGDITIDSEPGSTVVTVRLPVSAPPLQEET
ncbi:sensor histidine kinase [Buchananella hordeovulneris]|uniref:histidine kinase n=2 Tax=Buchananella hordeovulneris TaxID=52770 RepID=A0A1Q5PVG1_9ACTO|nr:ATP-binding protein [Buchananella hordeovulneris]OKL51584.1 hypothetical protein BSZ40_06995 [Buchananella hordeovulneris]